MPSFDGLFTSQDQDTNGSVPFKPAPANPIVDAVKSGSAGLLLGAGDLSMGLAAPIIGRKKADELSASAHHQFTPVDQGTTGHITQGVAEFAAPIIVTAPLGGVGGLTVKGGLALTKTAAAVGTAQYTEEHAQLVDEGVNPDDAVAPSLIHAGASGLMSVVPAARILKGTSLGVRAADLGLTVGGVTAIGQGEQALEGVDFHHLATQAAASTDPHQQSLAPLYKQLGDQHIKAATDPTNIGLSLALGTVLHTGVRWLDKSNSLTATHDEVQAAQAAHDQAVDGVADLHTEITNPLHPNSMADNISHTNNLDAAGNAISTGQAVKLNTPTTGSTTAPKQAPIATPVPLSGAAKQIQDEATKAGFSDNDARYLVGISHYETGGTFSPTAKNPKSSATGMFQMTKGTWADNGGTTANRLDPATQIKLGVKNIADARDRIKAETGHTLTGSQLYLPQLLGADGALHVMKADPHAPMIDVMSQFDKNAAHTMKINNIKPDATVQEAIGVFTKEIEARANRVGGNKADPVAEPTAAPKIDDATTVDSLDTQSTPAVPKHDLTADEPLTANTHPSLFTHPDDPIALASHLEDTAARPASEPIPRNFESDPSFMNPLATDVKQPEIQLPRPHDPPAAERLDTPDNVGIHAPTPHADPALTIQSTPVPEAALKFMNSSTAGQQAVQLLHDHPDISIPSRIYDEHGKQVDVSYTAGQWKDYLAAQEQQLADMTKAMEVLSSCAARG